MKRAQHPRDIAQRRTFRFSPGQCPKRFAFKINDDKAAVGANYLAEVIITMHPRFRRLDGVCLDPSHVLEDIMLRGKDGLDESPLFAAVPKSGAK